MTATLTEPRIRAITQTVDAGAAALAWYNAFLATSQEESRQKLYRTLSVEFFSDGVQFVATDGTILFRTWVPAWEERAKWPHDFRLPLVSVIVLDDAHFALGFIRTLMAATKDRTVTLTLSVEEAPERAEGEPALGDEFSTFVLTLRALGQQLHCRLFEDTYPDWRQLDLGVLFSERVDGTALSTRALATLGKLKNITALDFEFGGENRRIDIKDRADLDQLRGLVMPMQRREAKRPAPAPPPEPDVRQTELETEVASATYEVEQGVEGNKVKVDGVWVEATPENMHKAAMRVVAGMQKPGRRGRPGSDHE